MFFIDNMTKGGEPEKKNPLKWYLFKNEDNEK